jgi:hypothetical protein
VDGRLRDDGIGGRGSTYDAGGAAAMGGEDS